MKNDILKLLEFFKEMGTQNECFYYKIQLDENNVIQNVFWSHVSQGAKYVEFGDVVTLTPHVKQLYIACCLQCLSDLTISSKMSFLRKLY
jgi:hypothetical protein